MDNLTYTYEEPSARLNTNRLLHVQDAVSGSTNLTDFEVTAAHNPSNPYYAYDQIGNLVKDSSEAIQKIEWDVYGKLKKVDRNSASGKPDIEFFYNSAGQRIMKIVKPNGGTGAMSTWKYTIWAYDLGGNVMAEYGIDYVTASNKYTINAKSHFLYGAGRLGKDLRDSTDYVPLAFRPTGAYTEVQSCSSCATDAVAGAGSYLYGPTVIHTRQLGYKQFELSNHTGNILMVVSDRKNAVDIGTWVAGSTAYNTASTDRKLDYYVADVVEVTDYYPGGMPMPGRSIVDTKFSSFKWGHNGQHNDDEIYGKGNTQMAEFWEYDARLMRRWNTDPLAHAGQSLYEAFYSNPIAFADPLGLKPEKQMTGPSKRERKKQAREKAEAYKRVLEEYGYEDVRIRKHRKDQYYKVTAKSDSERDENKIAYCDCNEFSYGKEQTNAAPAIAESTNTEPRWMPEAPMPENKPLQSVGFLEIPQLFLAGVVHEAAVRIGVAEPENHQGTADVVAVAMIFRGSAGAGVKGGLNLAKKVAKKVKGVERVIEEAPDLISSAAKKYKLFQCMECASEIVDALKSKGVKGEILDITTPSNKGMAGNIFSDKVQDVISTNGRHRAVLVNGKVYDNINPNGIDYDQWIKDLNSPFGYTITKTPF